MEKRPPTSSYCPIKDYAIIGDCRCAALVSNRGSIDWLCLPRFDSPAWFAAILDSERGGSFLIQPAGDFTADQAYINHTNLVQTSFKTETGVLRLTDFMPIHSLETQKNKLHPERDLLRSAECTDGEVELEFRYTPRPDYGRAIPRLTKRGALGLFCEYKGTVLVFRTDFPAEFSPERGCAWGRARLRKGERCTFSLSFAEGEPAILPPLGAQAGSVIESTVQWWNRWSSSCSYEGPYRKEVLRSALALKLMTYAPSGAVIAAPTTSLPEKIGGVRNWDYRYCWLRDASMTLRALYRLGYKDEGASFLSWLLHTTRLTRPELQVVYNVYGEKHLEEQELKHLEGYAKSSPVRIGNNAAEQKQIDIYGEVLAAAYDFVQWGGQLDRSTRGLIVDLGKTVCRKWKEPDEGIWEIRAAPRHHTFSKAMCWVALDRILKLIGSGHLPIDAEDFQKERDAIRSQVESRGYSEKLKSYTSSFESEDLDASLLLLPVFGYIDGKHPRVRSTYERIQEQLGKNGLLFRYVSVSDGLPPGEGAFAIASFWDVECLALQGDLGQAKRKFEEILSFANHVGLFGEEIDPETGGALGNFPQAYTHVGLINAALTLADCESGKREA